MENEVKVEKNEETVKEKKNLQKKNNSLVYIISVLSIVIIAIIILLLLKCCGDGNKYKIKLHYGDEEIEVDQNFKLSYLQVDGGKVTFLVDSEGNINNPNDKLDPSKEYSGHIIPDGKEKVNVTYKIDKKSFKVEYQKGAGLLFPKDPKKVGYVFLGWQDDATKQFPKIMTPVMHDMTLVAKFGKKVNNTCKLNCDNNGDGKCDSNCDTNGDGKADSKLTPSGEKTCKLNCDTNDDGKCDVNCDVDCDGKADHNIDTDGDGKPDINIKPNGNQVCKLNCDTDGDGKADTNLDTDGDGSPDLNVDTNGDEKADTSVDKDGDGICDEDCLFGNIITMDYEKKKLVECNLGNPYWTFDPKTTKFVYLEFDGKEISESEFKTMGNGLRYWSYADYKGSNRTINSIYKIIYTDETGQKYYYTYKYEFVFELDCVVELKCEDYNDGFYYASPVKKDQIGSTILQSNKVVADKFVEKEDGSYPLYDLTSYYGSDQKYIWIQIYYLYRDALGNTMKTTYIQLPKDCDLGDIGVSEYTLTFDPNGGSVSPTSQNYYQGQLVSDLPIPKRNGYQFEGWYTEKNGGTLVDNNYAMPEGNTTIYAHWESNDTPKQTYTLTFNANGGSVSPTSKSLNEGATYGSLPTPSRTGYTFDGWYTKASGGSKVSDSTKINGDTTIYAHWIKNEPTPTPQPDVDNGTISLSASSTCVVSGHRSVITATVNNALDSTVNWSVDRCLSQAGSGNSITVIPDGCGSSATVTGSLNNGKSSSLTLTVESQLTVTVTTRSGAEAEYYNGLYLGNDLIISTNVPAYITGSGLLGNASELRTSAQTNGASQATVTITTPCGQTKTIKTYPVIN